MLILKGWAPRGYGREPTRVMVRVREGVPQYSEVKVQRLGLKRRDGISLIITEAVPV